MVDPNTCGKIIFTSPLEVVQIQLFEIYPKLKELAPESHFDPPMMLGER